MHFHFFLSLTVIEDFTSNLMLNVILMLCLGCLRRANPIVRLEQILINQEVSLISDKLSGRTILWVKSMS